MGTSSARAAASTTVTTRSNYPMADGDNSMFRPAPDGGQPGSVTLSTGQPAFRYGDAIETIYDSTTSPDCPES
jgi:hypothetical protein